MQSYERARFNQPLAGMAWPPALKQLSAGQGYDLPLEGADWPDKLEVRVWVQVWGYGHDMFVCRQDMTFISLVLKGGYGGCLNPSLSYSFPAGWKYIR